MSWQQVCQNQISSLELMASWASQVQLGMVRDSIRQTIYYLKQEIERMNHLEELEREFKEKEKVKGESKT